MVRVRKEYDMGAPPDAKLAGQDDSESQKLKWQENNNQKEWEKKMKMICYLEAAPRAIQWESSAEWQELQTTDDNVCDVIKQLVVN